MDRGSATCEQDRQRCWLLDYEREAAALRTAIGEEQRTREAAAADALRHELFAFWVAREPGTPPREEARRVWVSLRRVLGKQGIKLPQSPDDDSGFIALMNCLTSAKEGRPIGWRFKQLVEVGHRISEAYPQHVAAFGHALLHFGTSYVVESQDRTGKWKKRRQAIRRSLEQGNAEFLPDPDTLSLVGLLMPGVEKKLKKLMLRAAL